MKNINDLSPIKQRFRMVYDALGLNQREFGEAVGKSHNQISAILNDRSNISADLIQMMKYKLMVNPEYILHGKTPMFLDEGLDKSKYIPVIGTIPAGPWEYWNDSYAKGAGDDYVAASDLKGKGLFAIRVQGDSMEPKLIKGDLLIIDPHKRFKSGIAVVRHDEGYKIRNVRKLSKRKYLLMPLNSKYEDEEIEVAPDTRLYVPVKVLSFRDI